MLNRFARAFCASVTVLTASLALGQSAQAEGWFQNRETLGYGHFFNNDYLGDNEDRWQTGSYTISVIRGSGWEGALPSRPFEIMEYRASGGIIAPSVLRNPPADDRRYVGRLSFAAHTQFAPRPGLEADLGLGLLAIGPDTGISSLHRRLHEILSAPTPYAASNELSNHIYPLLTAEIGRPVDLGWGEVRPFIEARAGDEALVRAGVDLRLGAIERGALWLRDDVSGHRYVGVSGEGGARSSFVLGADVAHVFDSVYYPDPTVQFEPTRKRLRAGVSTQLGALGLFYGVTYLSEEFKTQPKGQVIGSLRARVNF